MPLYILSGGPGCGKSSVILYLERQHKHIVHEAAESTIRAHQALGQPQPGNTQASNATSETS